MSESFLESAAFWTGVVAVAFTAMAALAGLAAWYFSGQLSKTKEVRLELFQQESRLAIASADARAAEANGKASEAAEGTAKALSDAASANERAGRIELEAAEQRERAAKAEKELLELQQRLEPRRITDAQRNRLIDILSGSPKGTVAVYHVWGDAESQALAEQIDGILEASGWTSTVVSANFTGGNPVGLGLRIRTPSSAPARAGALQRAFDAVGLLLPGGARAEMGPDEVRIVVGLKP